MQVFNFLIQDSKRIYFFSLEWTKVGIHDSEYKSTHQKAGSSHISMFVDHVIPPTKENKYVWCNNHKKDCKNERSCLGTVCWQKIKQPKAHSTPIKCQQCNGIYININNNYHIWNGHSIIIFWNNHFPFSYFRINWFSGLHQGLQRKSFQRSIHIRHVERLESFFLPIMRFSCSNLCTTINLYLYWWTGRKECNLGGFVLHIRTNYQPTCHK